MTTDLSPAAAADVEEFDLGWIEGGADPKMLKIHANVRVDPRVAGDAEFLASIARRGVRTPISAFRNDAGELVVLRGQRRTLAAVMAGRSRVPVVVEPEPDEASRLEDQVMENDQRAGLVAAEHAAAYQQMEMLGFGADEIALRLSTRPEKVRAGLAVAKSPTAVAAVASLPGLDDLLRGAVFAEFADDKEALHQLTLAARTGAWDHTVQRMRDNRRAERERKAAEDELAATGVKVLRGQARIGTYGSSGTVRRLTSIRAKSGSTAAMQARNHTKCKGHAAYIEMQYGGRDENNNQRHTPQVVYVCTNPSKNGHELFDSLSHVGKTKAADLEPEEREAQRAERVKVKTNNAAMVSATSVRLRFVQSLLDRKKLPAGAGQIMAAAVFRDRDKIRFSYERGCVLAHQLFGFENGPWHSAAEGFVALGDAVSDARGQMLALVVILAAYEDNISKDCWRVKDGGRNRYLKFLASIGYELSHVEEMAAGLREVVNVADLGETVADVDEAPEPVEDPA